jgi:hypothetical protein
MTFLSPWFLLAGFLTLALPLWLHLLERQNPVRIPFSSLMFFRRRTERSIRHRRLRYLLLLASRLALLAFLALLFARPALRQSAGSTVFSNRLRLLALDTSFSMQYGDRWNRARSEALSLINNLRPGDRAQLLTFGPGVRVHQDPTDDRSALRAAVESLKPTNSRNSYGDLGQSLRALAQNSPLPAEVHVISDFQNSAMPGRFADLSLPPTATLTPHSIADDDARNWAVESVKGETRVYEKGRARLEAVITGFNTPAASRKVSLVINGKQAASQTVEVPESGRATAEFKDFEIPHGLSRGEVRIDSADQLRADDVRLVAFERSDPTPILFLHPQGRTREMLYYRTALEASGPAMFTLQPATPSDAGSLAPERFAFLVLHDLSRLPTLLEQRLKASLEAGASAFLILGPNAALEGNIPLLNRRVADTLYASRERERFYQAGQFDATHAALRGAQRFAGVKFFRFVRFDAPADRVLVRLSDNSPLLIEEPVGAGRLLVLTSPLDNIWNDLPVHPLFVPFIAESARYLAGVEDAITQAPVDSVLEIKRRRDPRAAVEVLDPSGRRALDLAGAVAARDVTLASTGFWEVRRAGRGELVAVNPDPRESDLRPIPADTLALWKSTGQAPPESGAPPAAAGERKTVTRDFWRTFLILALGLAVLESVLGNLHLGVRREVRLE